jgi:hypothetical protein
MRLLQRSDAGVGVSPAPVGNLVRLSLVCLDLVRLGIAVAARMTGSSSRSDFAASFGTGAIAILLRSGAASANKEACGIATLIAIEPAEISRQKRAIHIVLVILDPKTVPKTPPRTPSETPPKTPSRAPSKAPASQDGN